MSAETLAVLGSAVTIIVSTFAGFGWMISRMDRQFEVVDRKFEAVERDVAEIKVAVARLEGPTPRLVQSR